MKRIFKMSWFLLLLSLALFLISNAVAQETGFNKGGVRCCL